MSVIFETALKNEIKNTQRNVYIFAGNDGYLKKTYVKKISNTYSDEDDIFNFVKLVKGVVADNALLVLINSYTTGLQPTVMANILNCVFPNGKVDAYEIGLPTEQKGIVLPCGCTAVTRLSE